MYESPNRCVLILLACYGLRVDRLHVGVPHCPSDKGRSVIIASCSLSSTYTHIFYVSSAKAL